MMMEIVKEENMQYGLQMYFTTQIMLGPMDQKVHICFIIVHLQLGDVLVLDSWYPKELMEGMFMEILLFILGLQTQEELTTMETVKEIQHGAIIIFI